MQEMVLYCLATDRPLGSLDREYLAMHRGEKALRRAIERLYKSPVSESFPAFWAIFSAFEQRVMLWMLLGLSVEKIADYSGIEITRIHSVIQNIKQHSAWQTIAQKK